MNRAKLLAFPVQCADILQGIVALLGLFVWGCASYLQKKRE